MPSIGTLRGLLGHGLLMHCDPNQYGTLSYYKTVDLEHPGYTTPKTFDVQPASKTYSLSHVVCELRPCSWVKSSNRKRLHYHWSAQASDACSTLHLNVVKSLAQICNVQHGDPN